MATKVYELIAPCHFGLEAVLKKEILDLGYEISQVEDGKVTFVFPLSPDSAKNKAYAELAAKIIKRAKEAKRVSATPVVEENVKYYLRIWLVQLGMAGAANKEARKALLAGLKGHTAFQIFQAFQQMFRHNDLMVTGGGRHHNGWPIIKPVLHGKTVCRQRD